jgi:hypothetical protein
MCTALVKGGKKRKKKGEGGTRMATLPPSPSLSPARGGPANNIAIKETRSSSSPSSSPSNSIYWLGLVACVGLGGFAAGQISAGTTGDGLWALASYPLSALLSLLVGTLQSFGTVGVTSGSRLAQRLLALFAFVALGFVFCLAIVWPLNRLVGREVRLRPHRGAISATRELRRRGSFG